MLVQNVRAAAAEHGAEDESDEDGVVELTRDGDEVGYEVEGEREVGDQSRDEQLAPARDPPVGQETAEENDAVGNEPGEGSRVGAATGPEQPGDEGGVHEEDGADSHADRCPTRHALSLDESSDTYR